MKKQKTIIWMGVNNVLESAVNQLLTWPEMTKIK